MRSSSSTSPVRSHESPSHWSPLTASGGKPVRSWTVSRAAIVRSRAESRASLPSLLVDSAMGPICPHFPRSNQSLEQLVLRLRGFLLVDLPRLARGVDLHQLRADDVLLVELRLRLLLDALGKPDRAAY